MSSIFVCLAQLSALEELAPANALGKTGGMLARDIFLIVGALVVLSLILVFWAKSVTQRKRHRRHTSRSGSGSSESREPAAVTREHRHHRRRRSRRDHRARNPTLEQTGGLPPMRDEPSATSRP
jgi:FtsZ-interacting cell division protein ZipA